MSKEMKKPTAGRVPVTQKNDLSGMGSYKAISLLDVPEACAKELAEKGLEGRWVDSVQLKKNQGFHKRQWTPHKFECLSGAKAINPFGATEGQYDGYLLRQQLVLASKPIEMANQRRKHNQMRAKLQANPGKAASDDFRRFLKENDKNAKVLGWDESDEAATGGDED